MEQRGQPDRSREAGQRGQPDRSHEAGQRDQPDRSREARQRDQPDRNREAKRRERKRGSFDPTAVWYRLREKAGMAPITEERIRQWKILHPGEDAETALREEDRKRIRYAAVCLGGALLLTAAVAVQNRNNVLESLTRPGYGEADQEVTLDVRTEEEEQPVSLVLQSRLYPEDELDGKFQEAWESAKQLALGDNPDWNHISTDLELDGDTGVPGIEVSWYSRDPEYISSAGTVTELAQGAEGEQVTLLATLTCDEEERQQELVAVVVPPTLNEEQERQAVLTEALEEAAGDRESDTVELPKQINGWSVSYPSGDGTPVWLVPLLGFFAAAAMWLLPGQRKKEELEKRERALAVSYSELVWKLTVLLGAGLTVRGAWERIVRNYQKEREEGAEPEVLYEEMQMTWNSMSQGIYEEKAYAEFGRRCGLQPYLRLGSLLETNVRRGGSGMLRKMQEEADAAFEERLQLAKRQGEEASSKLLMPMMLLFALVLVMLMLPAMFQMM